MRETWLKPNRRAIAFGAVLPLAIVVAGAAMAARVLGGEADGWRWAGWLLIGVGGVFTAMLLRQWLRPRIAYAEQHVQFYLRSGPPILVPAEVVEAFFLGQGPATLPVGLGSRQEAVNLVARLSQRHLEWARHEVKPALGAWCDGYVTIRGTWCEPLDGELIRRLNRRLKEVKTAAAEKVATT